VVPHSRHSFPVIERTKTSATAPVRLADASGEPRATRAGTEPGSGRDGRPVPRWAVVAAHLTPLVILPSGLWRIGVALGLSMGIVKNGAPAHIENGESIYVVGLSVVSEAAALLTLGLVRPWGERVPSWLPVLGGRRVAPAAAITPALIGALIVQVIWAFAFRDFPDLSGLEFSGSGWKMLMIVCYLPGLLWAPLLVAVTYAYYRRRCHG